MYQDDEKRAADKAAKHAEKIAKRTEKFRKTGQTTKEVLPDWTCNKCQNLNFSFRSKCNSCGILQINHHLMAPSSIKKEPEQYPETKMKIPQMGFTPITQKQTGAQFKPQVKAFVPSFQPQPMPMPQYNQAPQQQQFEYGGYQGSYGVEYQHQQEQP